MWWFTPKSRGTWEWFTNKNWSKWHFIRSWSARYLSSSYVTCHKVVTYPWTLAIIRGDSPSLGTSSPTVWNGSKRSGNFLPLGAGWSGTQLGCKLVKQVFKPVCQSYLARHHLWELGTVMHRSQVGRQSSQVGRGVVHKSQGWQPSHVSHKSLS